MIRERSAKEKTENLIIYLRQTRITDKNHREISCNPISASTYNNPPAKSVSNYYNLAHYDSGLTAIQLPHPSTKKQVDDPGVMFKMHDT
jgi:hypothetical protein